MTIAGSDPSGGAGLQADLKAFHQHGVYGTSVVTLLTIQNTQLVTGIQCLEPAFVIAQLEAVLSDIPPAAAKTGALGNATIVGEVACRASTFGFPLVVDPVLISKHGTPLVDEGAAAALRDQLLPYAFLVTPNLHEARALSGRSIEQLADVEQAAAAIAERGPRHVLITGWKAADWMVDILWTEGRIERLSGRAAKTRNVHGSGCVYSAAITANLARGMDLLPAIEAAKAFITAAIAGNPDLGEGVGPVNMHAPPTASPT